ncbi:MAG: DUF922 domain-containing protein [Bacteroidales bacterium]|jgi:hypothetical protein|nr:DUF922 domain-containing protein [Bacteroidales bacterium]
MKSLRIIVLALCAVVLCAWFAAPPKKQEKIVWGERLLAWTDFKAKAPASSPNSAMSMVGVESAFESDHAIALIDIVSVFYPAQSWAKMQDTSQNLLQHEQGHFDIVEIFARKFRKKLLETNLTSKNIQQKYEQFFASMNTEKDKFQELYDKETNFSRNKEKQAQWNARIAQELTDLEQYNNTTLKITLQK